MTTTELRADIFKRLNALPFHGPTGFWGVLLEAFTCPPEFNVAPMPLASGARGLCWLVRSDNILLLTRILEDITVLHGQKMTPFSKIRFGRSAALDAGGDDGIGFGYDFYRNSTTLLTGYDFFGDRTFIEGCRQWIEGGEPAESWKKKVKKQIGDANEIQNYFGYPPWREE